MRIYKARDIEGNVMYINVDQITTIMIPSQFAAKPNPIAHVMLGSVNCNMTPDIAMKIAACIEEDVINPESKIIDVEKRVLIDLQGKLEGQN